MAKIATIYGQHRSLALADQHRRQIEREFQELEPESIISVFTTARRNAQGRFSKNGQFFTFEVYSEKEEEEPEYGGAFDSPKKE